jgi:hypothetical protein
MAAFGVKDCRMAAQKEGQKSVEMRHRQQTIQWHKRISFETFPSLLQCGRSRSAGVDL